METLRILTLLVSGLALPLSLAFLIILLWFDSEKSSIQSFSLFIFLVFFWHGTKLLYEVLSVVDSTSELVFVFSAVSDIGLACASVGLYVFVTSLIVAHTRLLRFAALSSLSVIVVNNVILLRPLFNDLAFQVNVNAPAVGVSVLYFIIFNVVSLYLLIRYRRKIYSRGLLIGLFVFIVGQGFSFLNPQLGISSFGLLISGIGIIVTSFSIVRLELIDPLEERISQVQAIQQISLSIMQRSTLEYVVSEAVEAVVKWLDASAAVVYLVGGHDQIELASRYEIPEQMLQLSNNQGVVRHTVKDKKSILLENYVRDWSGESDFVLETDTVGSVMSVPLFAQNDIVGVLLVISGRRSKLFEKRDLGLLEQLSDQVAVAISHSQLYEHVARSHAQLHTVLESTYNPVIATTPHLKIMFCNPSAKNLIYQLMPHAEANMIIYGEKRIPREFLPEHLNEFFQSIHKDGTYTYEYNFADSAYVCRVAPLQSAQTDGWVAVLNDITKLRELDRMKNEMVRMTSHDLKNPIQAIVVNLDLLREDIDPEDTEIVESVDNIEKQIDRMSRIIGSILDLERLEMIKDGYLEVNSISDILMQTVDEIESYAKDKSIELIVDLDVLSNINVQGDFEQLKRAFVNLIENAIKFTPKNGTVWIEGDTSALPNMVSVKIRDTGVGIPVEIQDRIFDRFFRGQQSQFEHVSGSGLGLSFVKSIVERYGGSISIDSKPDSGSCFTVELLSGI